MRSAALILLFVLSKIAAACSCAVSQSVCQEVANSNLVFIGTVEAVQPRLNSSGNDSMNDPEIVRLKNDKSEPALRALKGHYLKLLSGLSNSDRALIESAKTQAELQSIVTWIEGQGTTARFRVRTLFQRKEDQDSDSKKAEAKEAPRMDFVEVSSGSGDCGILFQKRVLSCLCK